MKKILLILPFVLLSFAFKAEAAIWPVSLDQENPNFSLSNDLTIEITSYEYSGNKLYVDHQQEGNNLAIKVFPSSAKAKFNLVTSNAALKEANPQYTFVDVLGESIEPEELPEVVDFYGKNTLFEDDQIVVESDQVSEVVVNRNYRKYHHQGQDQVSFAYDIQNPSQVPLNINLGYNKLTDNKKVAKFFDYSSFSWKELPTYNDIDESSAFFETDLAKIRVAIFEKPGSLDGKASWYDQSYYGTFDYKNGNFVAHRDYPKGTKLRVTRLKTGKFVDVVVNDWGPEEWTGRLVDLEKQAFESIGSLGAGEIYVNIEVIND